MFYTYILRSISQPEQRYIGSTADLKSCLAIRRFFLQSKKGAKRLRRSVYYIRNDYNSEHLISFPPLMGK